VTRRRRSELPALRDILSGWASRDLRSFKLRTIEGYLALLHEALGGVAA
jgi:hypothetical protein